MCIRDSPIAVDNCDLLPMITKVDQTGLTSGDFFPIGKTTPVSYTHLTLPTSDLV